jgi:hypothetical protein
MRRFGVYERKLRFANTADTTEQQTLLGSSLILICMEGSLYLAKLGFAANEEVGREMGGLTQANASRFPEAEIGLLSKGHCRTNFS